MLDLDQVIQRARDATVRRDIADAYVRELERWRPRREPRRWLGWIAAAAVGAAAIAVLALRGSSSAIAPVQIGDRVAIIAEPGTAYRVVRASIDETAIEVEHGAVTARLWPGEHAHRLTLQGGGVYATAVGTVYSLAVDHGDGAVHVDEGTVEVRVGATVHRVAAGATWPPDRVRAPDRAPRLLAMSTPRAAPPIARPAESSDGKATAAAAVADPTAGSGTDRDEQPPAGIATGVAFTPAREAEPPAPSRERSAPSPPSVKDRWRSARRLRTRGELRAAIVECLAIADAHDATWSPIALVEAIRIYRGPLADPTNALAMAERMLREWPDSTLAGEARQLRCRALEQLGRGNECAVPTAP